MSSVRSEDKMTELTPEQKMKQYTHMVYEPMNGEKTFFYSEEEALEFIKKELGDLISDGIPEEYVLGDLIVAKITHRSIFKITDEKKNYTDPEEEWPYGDEFDCVGDIEMEKI